MRENGEVRTVRLSKHCDSSIIMLKTLFILLMLLVVNTKANEFITSFEEFSLYERPPYIGTNGYNASAYVEPGFNHHLPARVPALSGLNVLRGSVEVVISAPNDELIAEFSLGLFLHKHYVNAGNLGYFVGDIRGKPEDTGQWKIYSQVFETPVKEFSVLAFAGFGETIYPVFAIDDLRLVTIPEPPANALIGLGMVVWWAAALLRRRTVKRI